MKIIFMGNPEFAIPTLSKLIDSKHEIIAVVSNRIKNIGRNNKKSLTPVGSYANEKKIPLITPNSLKSLDFEQKLLSFNPDIFVVVAYKILPPSLINLPKFGSLNLHASLLPKYRGAGPIQWALINGDKTTGVTIFQISSKIDTGEVLDKVEVKIEEEDNMLTLGMRLCTIGADLMQNVINNLERGNVKREKQDINNISFAPKITKEMLIIDWSLPAEKIHNWVRGLSPWPGMYTTFEGKKIILFKTKVIDGTANIGEVIIKKDECFIGTGHKLLSILEIQKEGKKRMHIRSFLMGNSLPSGSIFGK